MANNMDRIDYDSGASSEAQMNFNRVAQRLESLMDARDAEVRSAMSDYQADGVSEEYRGKEARWNAAAGGVREVIRMIRQSLESSDEVAQQAATRAKNAVSAIG